MSEDGCGFGLLRLLGLVVALATALTLRSGPAPGGPSRGRPR
jgi:hypothetical protein